MRATHTPVPCGAGAQGLAAAHVCPAKAARRARSVAHVSRSRRGRLDAWSAPSELVGATPLPTCSSRAHPLPAPPRAASGATEGEPVTLVRERAPLAKHGSLNVTLAREPAAGRLRVTFSSSCADSLVLHWGLVESSGGGTGEGASDTWHLVPESDWPAGTRNHKNRAMQSPFEKRDGVGQTLTILLPTPPPHSGLAFVVQNRESGAWYADHGCNWTLRLISPDKDGRWLGSASEAASRPAPAAPRGPLPEALTAAKAYQLWEAAGRPQNADFGSQARRELRARLDEGDRLEDLCAELGVRAGADEKGAEKRRGKESERGRGTSVERGRGKDGERAASPSKESSEAGDDSFVREALQAARDILESRDPLRLAEKLGSGAGTARPGNQAGGASAPPAGAIELIHAALGADPAVLWRRLLRLESSASSGLLVWLRREESPEQGALSVHVATNRQDAPEVQLHWGLVPRGEQGEGRGWAAPPEALWPPGTSRADERAACTPLRDARALRGSGRGVSVDTKGIEVGEGLGEVRCASVRLSAAQAAAFQAVVFVLRSPDGGRWWRDGAGDFVLPLPAEGEVGESRSQPQALDALCQRIVAAESQSAWTLMHRFHAAADVVEEVLRGGGADEREEEAFEEDEKETFEDETSSDEDSRTAALLAPSSPACLSASASLLRVFVWLRLSASRQLTWQRRYNTQPRLLGEAQARLSLALARACLELGSRGARHWARACLGCVGRGQGAQAVRDQILAIMHRHRIPEKHGTWMEQWHQKLHNNTTPDDVAICEAYIAFVEGKGDDQAYWRVLKQAGLDAEHLASYDRPITVPPALVHPADSTPAFLADLRAYLTVLNAVHSGADLCAAAQPASKLDLFAKGGERASLLLRYLLSGRAAAGAPEAAVAASAALRLLLTDALDVAREQRDARAARDLLYLDLALEGAARAAVERAGLGSAAGGAAALRLMAPLLAHAALGSADARAARESWTVLAGWRRAEGEPEEEQAALRAAALSDAARRLVERECDAGVRALSGVVSGLGPALGVEEWAVGLFAEEVVRGGCGFALSLALSALQPRLRRAARLGDWQVVAPGRAAGRLVVVDGLRELDRRREGGARGGGEGGRLVVLARAVTGEEDVPRGVAAVLCADAPDVLSHLAIRARNLGAVLAVCHDPGALEAVAAARGRAVRVATTPGGGVVWEEAEEEGEAEGEGGTEKEGPKHQKPASSFPRSSRPSAGSSSSRAESVRVSAPEWCGAWALATPDFEPGKVGAKSLNLARLRGRLPDSVRLPSSVAVPFGACEAVLDRPENAEAAAQLRAAVEDVGAAGGDGERAAAALRRARRVVRRLRLPRELREELWTGMREAGVEPPSDGEEEARALRALRAVWASKYNERAYLSCSRVGIHFDDVRMAVLCQRVVPARYAFVIHTHNPVSGDAEEAYAELVLGLGESIVSGQVPGSPLCFAAGKLPGGGVSAPRVLLFPSKTRGMFAPDTVIFRSDSNGEDLEGYAGAGLYDSVTARPSALQSVDYWSDPLLQDEQLRASVLGAICEAGLALEDALAGPQDVEGVVGPDGAITIVQTRPQV